jgi:ABC-type antimicrobial peptide transport system permease subunit
VILLDAASEGLHVIIGMLIVGLIFLGTILIGELVNWLGHRRAARRRARVQVY